MTDRLILGIIGTSITGGLSIIIFCFLSWLFRGKYGARSRKNGWILIAVCLLLPLHLVELPHIHMNTMQLPNLVIRETQESTPHTKEGVPQSVQNTTDMDMADSIQNKAHKMELSTEKILFCIWLAGALLLMAYHVYLYWKMCRRVRRWSRDCQDEGLHKTATNIAADLGLKNIPKIRLIKSDGPFTMGILKNIIFLPDEELFEKDMYYILKHELTHCRERDILWKLLLLTVNVIHWFNPLVWLLRRLAENDMEQVCDEGVLKNATKEERSEYSEVIMAWVEKNGQPKSPAATGYMTEMVFLKWRFSNIYDSSAKKNGAALFGVMCAAILLLGGAVDIRASGTISKTVFRTDSVPIDFGSNSIESRTDLNGDGKEDSVRVMDVSNGDEAYTQIVANVNGVDVAAKNYDGYYASTVVTGDLSGNGRADVVLVRGVYASNYGAVEISILHLEDIGWVEYPYHFIHNPDIAIEQPISFEAQENWLNGELYIEGATIFEKDGKTMVRFIQLLPEKNDETVNVIDASYRENGWYIEDIRTVDYFYGGDGNQIILAQEDTVLPKDFWKMEASGSDNRLKFATGLEIVLPKEWNDKVIIEFEYSTLTVSEKSNARDKSGVLFYLRLIPYERGYMSATMDTVLGLYRQGNDEYILCYLEPMDLQYVEGDEEKKQAYEELFSLLDSVQIITENMDSFTPCTIDDLEWLEEA